MILGLLNLGFIPKPFDASEFLAQIIPANYTSEYHVGSEIRPLGLFGLY